jgi:hypothetical protein
MIKVTLPKTVERMKDREKKKYAKALNGLSHAIYVNDKKTTDFILKMFNLKITDAVANESLK